MRAFERYHMHLKPLAFLLAVYLFVCAIGMLKLRDVNLDSEVLMITSLAMKADDPGRFSKDLLFQRNLHRNYTPLFLRLFNFAKSLTGDYQRAAFVVMAPLLLVYLFLMYGLVYDFCQDTWVSSLVCVMSLPQIYALYDSWGFISHEGEIVLLARMVFAVFLPLLILALFRWRNRPKFVPVFFFFLGLLTNVHPVSGFTLMQILLITFYIDRNSQFNVKQLIAAVAFWIIGAFPYVFNYVMVRESNPWWHYQEMVDYFNFRYGYALVIPPWKPFWTLFLRHSTLLILTAAAGMYIGWKRSSEKARFGVLFILSALAVAVLGQFLLFQFSKVLDRGLVNVAQPRAVRNIYPFLFLFVSLSLVYIKKKVGGWKSPVAVAAVTIIIMVPYATPRPAKAMVKQLLNLPAPQLNKKNYISLVEKVKSLTPEDALFLIDPKNGTFRGLTGRSIVVAYKDGGFTTELGRDVSMQWRKRYQEVNDVYGDPTQEKLLKVALKYRADYIVTNDLELSLPIVLSSGYYRVYEVPNQLSLQTVGGKIKASLK